MRPTLALLAALLVPGCLSGFSEIRVVGPDAGAVDRAPPVDERGSDAGAADAAADRAPGADSVPDDAPARIDAVPSTDLGAPDVAEADVVDAPTVPDVLVVDAVDVFEDRPAQVDAGAIVDAPTFPDAGTCPGGCLAGEVCEGGRCGRWVRGFFLDVDGADLDGRSDVLDVLDRLCDGWSASVRSRACRTTDTQDVGAYSICGNRSSAALGDRALYREQRDAGTYRAGCLRCVDGGTVVGDGNVCGRPLAVVCCQFDPR